MNPIAKAIYDIKYSIPMDILNLSFMRHANDLNSVYRIPISLDRQIETLVIRQKVLQDCNIVGGMTITIPLHMCSREFIRSLGYDYQSVIHVPYGVTGNREIISPLSVVFTTMQITYGSGLVPMLDNVAFSTNQILSLSAVGMNHIDTVPILLQTTNLELIGPNMILVHDPTVNTLNMVGYMRAKVEYSNSLSEIDHRSLIHFSKLCLLATKMYIYNDLIILLDRGAVFGGHELNKVQEIVSDYASAYDSYYEYLDTVWRKISFINDKVAYSRFIKNMINPIM